MVLLAKLDFISSWQYEMQLKRWNIRKNATRKEWEQHFAAHRDAQSIPTSLGVPDCTVPPVILGKSTASKKRAKRWASKNLVEPSAPQTSFSRTPRHEARLIPRPSSNEALAALGNTQSDVRDSFLNLADIFDGRGNIAMYDGPSISNVSNPNYLPWEFPKGFLDTTGGPARFLDPLQDFFDTMGGSAQSMDSCLIPLGALSSSAAPDSENLPLCQNLPDGTLSRLADLPAENPVMFSSILKDANFKQELPSAQLEHTLQYRGIIPGTEKGSTAFGGFASKAVADILSLKEQSMTRQVPFMRHFLRQLGSQVPGEDFALITGDQAFEANFVRALIYSVLNGLAGLEHLPMANILTFLHRFVVNKLLLDTFQQLPRYVSRPLADIIFRAAIEATDTKVVRHLLEYHLVDVNEAVCIHNTEKYTPIERAAALRCPELIKSLIHAGANINKFHNILQSETETVGGALKSLIQGIHDHLSTDERSPIPPESFEALNLLIAAGARVNPKMIIFGSSNRTLEFNTLIFQNILPESHREFFNVSTAAICRLDDQFATKLVRHVISLCEKAGCNKCLIDFNNFLRRTVVAAASAGMVELVRLLFDNANFSPKLPRIFLAAIESQTPALIDFILSHGPDLDSPAIGVGFKHVPPSTTPIAEAVRYGNEDLIRALEAAGSLDHLTQGGRFAAVVSAAAEAGNTAYMRKLLARAVTSKQSYRDTDAALSLAIRGGHQDIVQMLLESGAGLRALSGSHKRPRSTFGHNAQKGPQTVRALVASGACHRDIIFAFWSRSQSKLDILTEYPGVIHEFPDLELDSVDLQDLATVCALDGRLDFFDEVLVTLGYDQGSLNSCLETAVELDYDDLVRYLLDMGANPFDAKVLRAVIPDKPYMLRLLFRKKRRRQTTPKCIGARTLVPLMGNGAWNSEALDELISTNAINFVRLDTPYEAVDYDDPPDDRYDIFTPLGLAIQGVPGKFDTNMVTMRRFLEAGADPNGISKSDEARTKGPPLLTALLAAVETGREEAVKMLLHYGADVNARPRIRTTHTALQFAAELGNLDMVRLLISRGADVNSTAPSNRGATALQFAAMSGNCNIVAYLLDHGAQLDALPSRIDGMWPLEGAAANGRMDMIHFLWKLNADAVLRGIFHDGFSERHCLRAMNFARENGHMGCRDFISELSGISVDRLETDEYGAPWIAYDLPQA